MDYIKSATMIFGKIRNRVKEEKLKLRLTKKEVQQYIAGKEGEELVSKVLKDSFPEMILLDDIYMDVSDLWYEVNGYVPTMQIDHILISNHVIYVIETKKYPREAEVSGSSFSQTWTYKDSSIRHSSRLDFTPWVAENVDLLADAVGLDITVDETESSVGDFNVDIYASETGSDRKIIIENQLEEEGI